MGPALIQMKISKSFTPQSRDVSCTFFYLWSHLRQEIRDAEIYMPGFKIYRVDRQVGIEKGELLFI